MRLGELLTKACLGGCVMPLGITEDTEVTGIVTDSKKATIGSVFVCIRGLRADGHNYLNEAVNSGAVLVVTELGRDVSVGGAAAVKVENTRRTAALLYNVWYGFPADNMRIIAVTGTNGKTSVTYMLKAVFESAGHRCGLIGTVGCISACDRKIKSESSDVLANMTTPDPDELYRILREMADDGVQYLFLEATSHASVLCKLDALHFDISVFTNLTQDHLDFHGDMESYFAAKAKYFTMCDRAIINTDDAYGARLAALLMQKAKCKTVRVGTTKDCNYSADDIVSHGIDGSTYTLRGDEKREITGIDIPVAGMFSVTNSLLAACAALECGIEPKTVYSALASFDGVSGRMERILLPDTPDISVFIDYAHTPDALENLLKTVKGFAGGRRVILVFGCGGDRDRTKRKEMAHIASRLADFTVITSDNSRSEKPEAIISDILTGIDKESRYTVIPDRRCAIEYTVAYYSRPGDIILLAGKGHEKYEINGTGRHPFDEKNIVLEASHRLSLLRGGDGTDRK